MKKADGWEEKIETIVNCPYYFQNVVFKDKFHKQGDEFICPECGNEFELGESA